MSFVRWSSIWPDPFTDEETIENYKNKLSLEDKVALAQEKDPNAVLSDWYIYWHSWSGDESNKREDQYLAMWLAGEDEHPVCSYNNVKEMLELDDWTLLGFKEIRQPFILKVCAQKFIDRVDAECEA